MRFGRRRADAENDGSLQESTDPFGTVIDPDGDPAVAAEGEAESANGTTPLNRTVWVMAVVAVLSLGAGIVLSRFVISPAQAAADAEPPEAGLITVEVESRELSSDIVARGDATYDDAVSVTLETGDLGGPAIVTGGVPEVGAIFDPGSIALEIAGRPVLVLPGDLPVYRTLRAGVSGPDVAQLQWALGLMGYNPGTSGTYDAQTAGAVAALFAAAGYPAPAPPEGTADELVAARDTVRSAEQGVTSAQAALDTAAKGASNAERIRQDNAVNAAQRTVNEAYDCYNAPAPVDPETGQQLPKEPCALSIADAEDALRLAKAERTEALSGTDTSAEVASRDAALRDLDSAREQLVAAELAVITPLPASEVLYVGTLPRRVDTVEVKRGSTVTGPVMTISGATLEIVASIDPADAALLTVGEGAELTVGDDVVPATISEITAGGSGSGGGGEEGEGEGGGSTSGRTEIVLEPTDLTEEQRTAIAGTNVRIRIPVSSTEGSVTAVPIAALTAGPGGESRVEVLRKGETEPELVVVTTGLSAGGYAEVVSSEAALEPGDLVVVGR